MIHPDSEIYVFTVYFLTVGLSFTPDTDWVRALCRIPFILLHLYRLNKSNIPHPVDEQSFIACKFLIT